jgi:hypothetical protein
MGYRLQLSGSVLFLPWMYWCIVSNSDKFSTMKLLMGPFSVFSIHFRGMWSEYVYKGKGELRV